MADSPASIANLLRDPAERHPQRLYENGVLVHNWAEDRFSGHQQHSADRTMHPLVQPPQYVATTLTSTEKVMAAGKTYVAPPWRQHTEPYSNDSLMQNWMEDRHSRPHAGNSGQRVTMPTLRSAAEQQDAYQSTKTVFDARTAQAPPVNKPAKPAFVTLRNVSATTQKDRSTRGPQKGFGAVLPNHPDDEGRSYYLTTHYDFVHQGAAAKAEDPAHYARDASHARIAHVRNMIWENGKRHPDAPGRGGARGEISRNPTESGAKHVAEPFVDVYAQQFSKA